jgi:Ni,Fe-hydrogenase III large subunit
MPLIRTRHCGPMSILKEEAPQGGDSHYIKCRNIHRPSSCSIASPSTASLQTVESAFNSGILFMG